MADLGDHPQAQRVVEKLLADGGLFPDLESLDIHADVFSILAKTDPEAGLRALERLIGHLPRDALLSFKRGRRHVVWTLERLAWLPETFFGAARLLLALAEAENERYGNNATGVWTGLFGTRLGDTAAPAIERHRLIDEALDSASVERRLLAVRALNRALSTWESGGLFAERQGGRVVPSRWRPKDWLEDHAVRRSALELLDKALSDSKPTVVEEARKALLQTARGLIKIGLAGDILPRIESLEVINDAHRRQVSDTLQSVLTFEGSMLTESQIQRVRARLEQLLGITFQDRLRRWVGQWSTADRLSAREEDRRPEDWAATMAEEAYENPNSLQTELDWLASSEARNIWFFARRLGELDESHQWLPELFEQAKSGFGLTLLAGYLRGRADAGETEWREAVLDQWAKEEPALASAVLEATWRGESTDRGARRLTGLVDRGWIEPGQLSILAWGGWTKDLAYDVFEDLLARLVEDESPGATESALVTLLQRLEEHQEQCDALSPLAWTLLQRRSALKGSGMLWDWQQVAYFYVSQNPIGLAKAVLSLFDEPDRPSSMSDERMQILEEAIRADPEGVWQEVAKILLRQDETSSDLRWALKGGYVTLIDTDYLLKWAEEHKPTGPRIVASLAWVGRTPLQRLPRQLLIRYGDDEAVTGALRGDFLSGSWSGPTSVWLEGKLAQAREWTNDEHPIVRQWAGELVESIERDLRWAKQWEEERGF